MRWFNRLMFVTFWISGCSILPVAITTGVSTAFDCLIVFLISSIWFMLPTTERS